MLSPADANGDETPTLQVFTDEPLAGAPVATPTGDVVAQLIESSIDGRSYTWRIDPLVSSDVIAYRFDLTATDLVGNAQSGGSLCGLKDREGSIDNRAPVANAAFGITPSVSVAGEPTRARAGATLTLTVDSDEPIGLIGSTITFGDVVLVNQIPANIALGTTPQTWRTTFTAELGPGFGHTEGLKRLVALLVDERGNGANPITHLDVPTAQFVADFTAPEVVSSLLLRTPFFAPADDGSGTVLFNDFDPVTGIAVRADLLVFTDERLSGTTTLAPSGAVPFTGGAPDGTRTSFALPSIAGVAQGKYSFAVLVTDAVGNTAWRDLIDIAMIVDRTGPTESPATGEPDRVVYTRVPWGAETTGGEPVFRVDGGSESVPGEAVVLLTNELGSVLASARADGDGAFGPLTAPSDADRLFVAYTDDAGNPSVSAPVRDVVWTGTLGGKQVGNLRGNPHRFFDLVSTDEGRLGSGAEERGGVLLSREEGNVALSTGGFVRWLDLTGTLSSAVSSRYQSTMAYDPVRSAVLLFGGRSPNVLGDTWTFDGRRWSSRTQAVSPNARYSAAATWDAAREVLLLHGGTNGQSQGGLFGDLWSWDGTSWTVLTPTPGNHHEHAFVYDPVRQVSVLIYGRTNTTGLSLQAVREWDGTSWSDQSTGDGTSASNVIGRVRFAAAWDPGRDEVMVFGGQRGSLVNNDQWTWNGARWSQVFPATRPAARHGAAMAFDPDLGQVLLFGGQDGTGAVLGDTWAWNGASWANVTPANPPAQFARADARMVWDPTLRQLVLYGGQIDPVGAPSLISSLMHTWDGTSWQPIGPLDNDDGRRFAAMAPLPGRGEVVVHNGRGSGSATPLASGRVWNGWGWASRSSASAPTAREGGAAAWIGGSYRSVLTYGGRNGGTFYSSTHRLNQTTNSWRQLPVSGPQARALHAMAWDSTRNRVVLYGGLTATGMALSDTWLFNPLNGTWAQSTPSATPPALFNHRMAWDPISQRVILHGGRSDPDGVVPSNRETWAWDGSTWSQACAGGLCGGGNREEQCMVLDEGRGAIVMFGGHLLAAGAHVGTTDVLAWTGAEWLPVTTRGLDVGVRSGGSCAWDPAGRGIVWLGSGPVTVASGPETTDSTLFLDTRASATPGQVFELDLSSFDALPEDYLSASVRWVVGGVGFPGGAPGYGAELLRWGAWGWDALESNSSVPTAPTALVWDASDPSAFRRTLVGGDAPVLYVGTRPVEPNGAVKGENEVWGQVASDYVEVTVRYRLP